VLTALASVSWGESDYDSADAQYREALELAELDSSPEGRRIAFGVLTDWAGLVAKLGQGERGVELARRAIRMVESLPDVEALDRAVLYNNLAVSYDALEQYRQSIDAYETSIELHRLHSDAHPDLATALGNLGLTYELIGEMDKAIDTVARAVDMQRELLGADHPQYVLMLYNLGSLQINADRLDAAASNLEAAARAAVRAYPPNHLYTGRFNHRLAAVYAQLGRTADARSHAERAAQIYSTRDDVPENWSEEVREIARGGGRISADATGPRANR
jgi:tetratricopeptide (TPR) repeat protein